MNEEEVRTKLSAGESLRTAENSPQSRTYEFRPRFEDLSRTIDSEEGRLSDTWAISQKRISVTPLRANFQHVESASNISREIKL